MPHNKVYYSVYQPFNTLFFSVFSTPLIQFATAPIPSGIGAVSSLGGYLSGKRNDACFWLTLRFHPAF